MAARRGERTKRILFRLTKGQRAKQITKNNKNQKGNRAITALAAKPLYARTIVDERR